MNAKPHIPTPIPTPSPWARHAAAVLHAARRRDPEAMATTARTLIETHGPGVIPNVMLAWVDTVIATQQIKYGNPGRIVFADTDTGHIAHDASEVRPEVAWSGRLINARLACDEDSYRALMAAVPDDATSRHITTLLDCCAQSINLAIGAPPE